MTQELAEVDKLSALLSQSVQTVSTRRSYLQSLTAYRQFVRDNELDPTISRDNLTRWRNAMTEAGASASTVNVRMSGLKALIRELQAAGAIEHDAGAQVLSVKGVKSLGTKSGHWMDDEQAVRFMNTPPADTTIGIRDRALAAVMLGTGCRRSEIASLTMAHLESQSGMRIIRSLVGKGNRKRDLALPPVSDERLQAWIDRAGISEGRIFRSVDQFGNIGNSLSSDGVRAVIEKISAKCGLVIKCHDLRRSFAACARRNGAPLEEIQAGLGHSSINVTMLYVKRIYDPTQSAATYISFLK